MWRLFFVIVSLTCSLVDLCLVDSLTQKKERPI